MSYSNIIKGTDGSVPIFDTDLRWKLYSYDEIFMGLEALNKYIPKVGDGVVKWSTQQYYEVVTVDSLTGISYLKPVSRELVDELSRHEVIMGVVKTVDAIHRRIYFNPSIYPHSLNCDARILVTGTHAAYAMLFRGTDISETGEVISQRYSPSGTLIDNKVTLELALVENADNYTLKQVPEFYTNLPLKNGELVTLVIYNETGGVQYKRSWLIEYTDYVRKPENNLSYVRSIALESPFLDPLSDDLLRIPVNLPLSSLNLMGVIHYNDKVVKRPVDGGRLKLYGLNNLLSSVPGAVTDHLVLAYQLGQYETSSLPATTDEKAVTRTYRVMVDDPNNSYNIKLMAVVHWVSESVGYRVDWWLLNLDRDTCLLVTPHIIYEPSYEALNPLLYGVTQRKLISLPITKVFPTALPYRHTQLIELTFHQAANGVSPTWSVDNDVNDAKGAQGLALWFKRNTVSQTLDISQNRGLSDWLDLYYYPSKPINLSDIITTAPMPSHIEVTVNNTTVRQSLANWPLVPVSFGMSLNTFTTAVVKFLKLLPGEVQYLSVIGVPIID